MERERERKRDALHVEGQWGTQGKEQKWSC